MEDQYIEPEEINPEEVQEEEHVEIYSKNAIRGFSIFFSTIFGGVLLYRNLRNVGYKKAANTVLIFSILYGLAAVIIVSNFINNSAVSIVFNVIGGFILTDYFFPKYFPENDYYPKPVWKALGISLLICITMVLILYYTGNLPELASAGKIK